MNAHIVPIKKLPPGLTGHLEIRDILAKRDWRDTAAGWAAVAGTAYFALPHLLLFHWLESVIGVGLTLYLLKATAELRIFTPIDQCSVRVVVEPATQNEGSEERNANGVEASLLASTADEHGTPGAEDKRVNAL